MGERLRWLLIVGALALVAVVGPASRADAAACTG